MKVSTSQPTLFPWIGYFDMIKNSDVFVFMENVQFNKQSWQMRNRLKTGSKIEDAEIWVRIPTKAAKRDTQIKDILIDNNQDWKQKHLDIFQNNYGSKYRDIQFLVEIYEQDWEKLADFNINFISKCCQFLDISTKLVRASELHTTGKKSHLVLDICKRTNSNELLANAGSKDYLEADKGIFEKENIKVSYHDYQTKPYGQGGTTFLEQLSILDLLFSEFDNSKEFI